jgi:hypothetical protein
MPEQLPPPIRHFRYGEAYNDLRTAFYVDPRKYPNADAAAVAVDSARGALRKLRIIFEIEVINTKDLPESLARPSWEDFKKRHFVDGEPLPVRGRPDRVTTPPSWEAMHEEIRRAHSRFRAELVRLAETALPGSLVVVEYDRGPLRRGAGSIYPSEEKFGFEVDLSAKPEYLTEEQIGEQLTRVLTDEGWDLVDPGKSRLRAVRERYEIEVAIEPGDVFIAAKSPLYSAPSAPAQQWITEPRAR